MNIKYSNGSIFIQFDDGEFIIQECDKDTALQVYDLVLNNAEKEIIFAVLDNDFKSLMDEVKEIEQSNQLVLDLVESTFTDKFYIQNNQLFRTGIPIPIPKVLANKIQNILSGENIEELNKFDKFWAWTSQIRNADSRESFYSYIASNNIPITKEGFIIAFRRAHFVGKVKNKELQEFVTQEFFKLRKNKKSTNVIIYENKDGEYTLKSTYRDEVYHTDKKNDIVGNLKDIYLSLGETEDYYESSTAGLHGKLKYRIGVETREKESDVDWSDAECSRGEVFALFFGN